MTHEPRLLLAAALGLALTSCALNPATGKRQLSLISEQDEVAMGREADRDVAASMGLYPDAELEAYVRQVGERLAGVSERPDLEWTFHVVDDPTVNAFALPGGYLYVTRGILAHLQNEAELAAVLGHEIGHVTARHSVNQMSKAQLAQLGLGLGTVLGGELGQALGGFAGQGLGLLFLKFSRDDERQADDLGLRYVVAAGYDPRPMPGVYEMLRRVGESGESGVPAWMSTHPAPEDRKVRLEAAIGALPGSFEGRPVRGPEYLAHIDGVVFGEDPREGFFEGQRFYHPGLALRIDFPAGWTTRNDKQRVRAMPESKDAVVQLALSSAASPTAGLDKFLSQQGITAGASWRDAIGGASAASREFSATTSEGTLRGLAVFVRHQDKTLALLGYGTASAWSTMRPAIESSLLSFGPLTDPAKLEVEPVRLDIVETTSASTLADLARQHESKAPVETLALLNRVETSARLPAGRACKIVR